MRFAPDGEYSSNTAEGAFSAAQRAHAAADRLAAERERAWHTLRETGRGWEPFKATVVPALRLRQARPTRTGTLDSTFHSNDHVHLYEGAVLGMRQRILAEVASSDLVLPSRFEFASPATIVATFRGMRERQFFEGAAPAKGKRHQLHGVPVTEAQARGIASWERDLGSRALAESLFAVSHAHDGAVWVPLDLFRTAERRILDSQEL